MRLRVMLRRLREVCRLQVVRRLKGNRPYRANCPNVIRPAPAPGPRCAPARSRAGAGSGAARSGLARTGRRGVRFRRPRLGLVGHHAWRHHVCRVTQRPRALVGLQVLQHSAPFPFPRHHR